MPSELALQLEEKHKIKLDKTDLNKEHNQVFPPITEIEELYSLNLTSEDLDYLADHLEWGSYGPHGDGELVVRKLNELDTDHLEHILYIPLGVASTRKVVLHILKKRYMIIKEL